MTFFQFRATGAFAGAAITAMPMIASAGVTLYDEGQKSLEIGGRLQPQYRLVDSDEGTSGDDLFLRRMRFYIEGSVSADIYGKWQIDFGDTSEDPEVKDAFIAYSGLTAGRITVGNFNVPYARELLASSKRQQFVERTVVGNHNFGVPDRQIGAKYSLGNELVQGDIGIFKAGVDPSFGKIDFESNVSSDAEYFGNLAAGRLNFTPLGEVDDYRQGAFGVEPGLGIGVNAFTWNNDDDVALDTVDQQYDTINGYGVDAAFRAGYFSADAAYQITDADTRGDVARTGFVNASGDAKFSTVLLKAGYMIVPTRLELVAGFSGLKPDDAVYVNNDDGSVTAIDDMDKRYSLGLNYFFNKHNAKIQLTYEMGRNVLYADDANGQVRQPAAIGDDQNRLFLQFQQVL